MGKGITPKKSSDSSLTEPLLSTEQLESMPLDRMDADEKQFVAVEPGRIDDASIFANHTAQQERLLKQLDDSFYSYFRWATLDVLLQKILHLLALSLFKTTSEGAQSVLADTKLESEEEENPEPQRHCCRRPHSRYTPLHRAGELKAMYAIQSGLSFLQKLIFRILNAFIATVLIYRSARYLSGSEDLEFMEFEQLFSDPEQDGIDTLVRLLADLNSSALLYVLASFPFVLSVLRGALASVTAKGLTEEVQSTLLSYKTIKISERSFLRDAIVPLFPRGFSGRMGDVVDVLCWDGRLPQVQRQALLSLLQDVAMQGHYVTQIVAMRGLSYIIHGGSERDLRTVSVELSEAILTQRQEALQTLQHFYGQGVSFSRYYWPRNLVQHVYAAYLLWWLGLSPSRWLSSGFFLFKAGKLTLQVLLIGKIIQSIETVLRCRHRRFEFGTGYVYGSDLFSAQCFTKRLELFRSLDKKESVLELIKTFSNYNFRELTDLNLREKYLTIDEVTLILDSLVDHDAGKYIKRILFGQGFSSRENFSYHLANFPNLEFLDLSIHSLDPQVLHGLDKLRTLSLSVLETIVWSADMLRDLQQLRELSLSTSVKELPEDLIWPLIQLTDFYLNGYRLTYLPDDLLQKNTLLKTFKLDLGDSNFRVLPRSLFTSTSRLVSVEIMVRSEFQWDLQIFSFTPLLENLEIFHGQLRVTSTVFAPLSQLKSLQFKGVTWHGRVPTNLFEHFSCLHKLTLTECQLSDLPVNLFHPLHELETLDLHDNNLESINFIRSLSSPLKTLDLSLNQIKVFPTNSSRYFPITLDEVIFSGNPLIPNNLNRAFLNHLPSNIRRLRIYITDPSHDIITHVDYDALYDFPNLEYVHLMGSFRQLPEELFSRNPKLTSIAIFSLQLPSLPSTIFAHQENLRQLALDSHVLQLLPSELFAPLVNLRELSMEVNSTAPLVAAHFTHFNQLETLWIRGVKNFPIDVLPQLTQLKELTIYHSAVAFPDGLHALVFLRQIFLNNNELTDQSIADLTSSFPPNLQTLNFGNNHITYQGSELLQKILPCSQITEFSLSEHSGDISQRQRMNLTIQNRLLNDICEDERCEAMTLAESCEQHTEDTVPKSTVFNPNYHYDSVGFFGSTTRHNHHRRATPLLSSSHQVSAYATSTSSLWILWPTLAVGVLVVIACVLYLRKSQARQSQKRQFTVIPPLHQESPDGAPSTGLSVKH